MWICFVYAQKLIPLITILISTLLRNNVYLRSVSEPVGFNNTLDQNSENLIFCGFWKHGYTTLCNGETTRRRNWRFWWFVDDRRGIFWSSSQITPNFLVVISMWVVQRFWHQLLSLVRSIKQDRNLPWILYNFTRQ